MLLPGAAAVKTPNTQALPSWDPAIVLSLVAALAVEGLLLRGGSDLTMQTSLLTIARKHDLKRASLVSSWTLTRLE